MRDQFVFLLGEDMSSLCGLGLTVELSESVLLAMHVRASLCVILQIFGAICLLDFGNGWV